LWNQSKNSEIGLRDGLVGDTTMNLSKPIRSEYAFITAAIGALALAVGILASSRLDSNQAQNLWLGALCLLLIPPLFGTRGGNQTAIFLVLTASSLAVASEVFGVDTHRIDSLVLILVGAAVAIRLWPAGFEWLVPGSAISLAVCLVMTALLDNSGAEIGTEIAGAGLSALACASALAALETRRFESWLTASCLVAASLASMGASLEGNHIWMTCAVLFIGASFLIWAVPNPGISPHPARYSTPQPGQITTSAAALAIGAAALVAVFHAEIELQWTLAAIIGLGIIGFGAIAFQWRVAFGDQIRQLERARRESRTDGLTGLTNRLGIDERLNIEVARSIRFGHSLTLLLIDLDDFKSINDRFGHATGDEALRKTANAIQGSIRSIDLAGRYGGEEFLVILPETASPGAEIVAERIRRWVEQSGEMTVSIGLASLESEMSGPAALIQAADTALYEAKRAGKNRIVLFA
jgi:diguanylate cyclase (GGDEF)-like protein